MKHVRSIVCLLCILLIMTGLPGYASETEPETVPETAALLSEPAGNPEPVSEPDNQTEAGAVKTESEPAATQPEKSGADAETDDKSQQEQPVKKNE